MRPDGRFGARSLASEVAEDEWARLADDALRRHPSGVTAGNAVLVNDGELRRAAGYLFTQAQEMVDRGEVNVVILAARRLVCIYELLLACGMSPLSSCFVISDRQLEANPDLRTQMGDEGVHALVLDDSVVLGSTLRRLHRLIVTKVGDDGSVRYRAICTDVDQVAPFLFDGLDFQALLARSSHEVQRFSTDLVKALYAHQIPFFSDFPVATPIVIDHEGWASALKRCTWSVADVTAPSLEGSGQSFALVPTDEALERLLRRTVPQVAALIDGVKLRFYIRRLAGDQLRVVGVPIAMVAPSSPSVLDEALAAIRRHFRGEDDGLRCEQWEPEAKHRLVQMYAAACVMAELWPVLFGHTPGREVLQDTPLKLYFGPQWPAVLDAFDEVVDTYSRTEAGTYPLPPRLRVEQPAPNDLIYDLDIQQVFWGTQELLDQVLDPLDELDLSDVAKVGTIVSHAVAAIFGYVNEHRELDQRMIIKALGGVNAYEEWLSAGNQRVLDQGFTLRELTDELLPSSDGRSAWMRSIISLGIDEGNDLGIIVPITRYDRGRDLVHRAYRFGETAGLAGTPLVELVYGTTSTDADLYVMAMSQEEVPALPANGPIDAVCGPDFSYPRTAYIDPKAYTRKAVKGRPVERYEGEVIEIDEERHVFVADLANPAGGDDRVVEFPITRLGRRALAALEPGAPIRWTIFESDDTDGWRHDRTSRIELISVAPIDHDQLARDVAALAIGNPGGDARPG